MRHASSELTDGIHLLRLQQLILQATPFCLIVEDEHNTSYFPFGISYRCTAVCDRTARTIACYEDCMVCQAYYNSFFQYRSNRVHCRRLRLFMNDIKYFIDFFSLCFSFIPPGQHLGNMIHLLNIAVRVGCDNAVTDAVQCGTESLFAFANRLFRPLALGDVLIRAHNTDDAVINIKERNFAGPQPYLFAVRCSLRFLIG